MPLPSISCPALSRIVLAAGLALFVSLLLPDAALRAQAGTPTSNDGFDPNFNGIVYAQVKQSDGKLLVAGNFTSLSPNGGSAVSRAGVVRINVDGTVDTTFGNPAVVGPVYTLVLQNDGRVLIGGDFSSVGGVARQRLARLNADGTLDTSFNPSANARVNILALQTDGKIIAGGAFTSLQPNGGAVVSRRYLARLNADGTVDGAYNPSPNLPVLSAAVQADGRALVGGYFTELQPNGGAVVSRSRLVRLNTNGTIDLNWDPMPDREIEVIVIQPDGKALIGGAFTSLQPNGALVAAAFPYAMRLNIDGTVDRTFYPRPNGAVSAIKLQSDGKIVIGGRFTTVRVFGVTGSEVPRQYLARINADGTLDTLYNPTPNFHIYTIEQQADGKLLVGGNFNQFRNQSDSAQAVIRNQYARLNNDGSVDTTFDPNTNGRVLDVAVQTDGKYLLAGNFASVGGLTRNFLARVHPSGAIDTGFAPVINGAVTTVAAQADGGVLIGGNFTEVNGVTRSYIARLNADGTLDTGFDPKPNFNVSTIVVAKDGKILVGGLFTFLLPNGATTRVVRNHIVRLNTDGTVDTSFDPNTNDTVHTIREMSNGQIVFSGTFTGVAGTNGGNLDFPRDFVARINADGTLDHTFTIHPGGATGGGRAIQTLVVQEDGKVIIGGAFVRAAGSSDPDFVPRNRIARYNVDGTLDSSFNPDANGLVSHLAVQSDGGILVGGSFTTIGGVSRMNVARLNSDGSVDTSYNPNPEGQLGTRPGALALLSNGQALLGGSFTRLAPNGGALVLRTQVARLNANGTVDTAFDAGISGQPGLQIDAIAVQPDGKTILGGTFSSLGGALTANLARFNTNGSPDTNFRPDANGPVHAVVVRAGITPIPAPMANFAWLDANGALRTSFDPGSNVRIEGQVFASAVQSDGKILVGGGFNNLALAGTNNLLRLNSDGTLDTTFTPSPDLQVSSITVLPDGKILIAGGFTSVGGVGRQRIARLNSDGSVDLDFVNTNASGTIIQAHRRSDGKILIVGNFETFRPPNETEDVPRVRIALLNEDGTIDKSFNAAANGTINTLAVQSDGKILIGGTFTAAQGTGTSSGTERLGIARLNADGSLDFDFDPNLDDTALNTNILAIIVQSDGKILVGGDFSSFAKASRRALVRLNADGTVDTSFTPNPNGIVTSIQEQSNGRILVAGNYSRISDVTRNNLARLLPGGAVDASFNLNVNGRVNSANLLSDGTVLVGGQFTTVQPSGAIIAGGSYSRIGGIDANNLALLNADGTAGSPFQPNPNGAVYALAAQPDNRIVVAGAFTTIGGGSRNAIARISENGSLDASFNPNVNGTIYSMALAADGSLVIGGSFSSVGGVARTNLARITSDGSLDAAFNPAPNGTVYAVVGLAGGGIAVGGEFTSIGGAGRDRIAILSSAGAAESFNPGANGTVRAIALQADGGSIVGGEFTVIGGQARNRIARFDASGTLVSTFDPGADARVSALTVAEDGKLIVGGSFTIIGGRARNAVARFGAPEEAGSSISISEDLTTITWRRSGSSPDLSAALFESSTDSVEWSPLGNATRVGSTGNWRLTGPSLSLRNALFIRARGVTNASQFSSSGLVDEFAGFFPRPVLTSGGTATTTTGGTFLYAISTSTPATSFSATGLPAGLSLDASTGIISGTAPGSVGSHSVAITANSPAGSAVSNLSIVVIASSGSTSTAGRLVALATRAFVNSSHPLISGIAIKGSTNKSVLFRGVGPGLTGLGVSNALPNPILRLYDSNGNLVLENHNWGGTQILIDTFQRVGEFPLDSGSADAAALVTLSPGNYTAHVVDGGVASPGGTVLAEVYDASDSSSTDAPRLGAISSRGLVNSTGNTLVGGLAIAGSTSRQFIFRGVGPNLVKAGVSETLSNPLISVFNSSGQLIARNDNWETPETINSSYPAASAATIASSASSVGLTAFDGGSTDAAIVITLSPGVYTIEVSPSGDLGGTGLVEIYELP
jgi:uncharacterized delta-60 repeat protein